MLPPRKMMKKELRLPVRQHAASWGIVWDKNRTSWTSDDRGLHCTYLKNRVASDGGTNFRAAPRDVFPCKAVRLAYQVFLPADWDPVKGGKLPGLYIGEAGAGGGNWSTKGASCRLMWRPHDGGREVKLVAYVYMCEDVGRFDGGHSSPLVRAQGAGFMDHAHLTGRTGIDMFRDAPRPLLLKKGAWNDVAVEVALNTPGKADGSVRVECNGVSAGHPRMRWRDAADMRIEGVAFATWYGGSSPDYAPHKDQKVSFRGVSLTRTA